MSWLTKATANVEVKQRLESVQALPIRVLQVGEGNFLRGFADWMINEVIKQGLFAGSVVVTQPRASGKHKIDELKAQDGLYTLVTRGMQKGAKIEQAEILTMFDQVVNPYEEWAQFMLLAQEEQLRFVISNTTEAGLVFSEEAYTPDAPIASFAGKLTALLYARFEHFNGAIDKGIICLPCELLERNGDTLNGLVLRYAAAWSLPQPFITWIEEANMFLNSLVDRIVTGYPTQEQADSWFEQWGYSDRLVTTAEPYHLWAIEAVERYGEELPFAAAGLNVVWVDDLKPYQQRKVAILNGAHTSMALLGLLEGESEVRLTMEHEQLGGFIQALIQTEVIATLPYEQQELQHYAEQVFERFMNPFIQHRLTDIAMNSLSKFKTRLLPAIRYYLERDGVLPSHLLTVLSAFVAYYQVRKEGAFYISKHIKLEQLHAVRDDEKLLSGLAELWSEYDETQNLTVTLKTLLDNEQLFEQQLNQLYPNLTIQLEVQLRAKGWV